MERSLSSDNGFAVVGALGPDAEDFTDTGLAAGTTYYYRVSAFRASTTSEFSNTANATTQAPAVKIPAAPSGLGASALSSSSIRLVWTDNSNNETGFKIERSPNGSTGWAWVATTNSGVTTYDDTGLSASTTYYYHVCATNSAGDSGWAGPANAATQALTYIFNGGTLASLQAVSPSLIFKSLTIDGALTLPESAGTVTFTVANLTIGTGGSIVVNHPGLTTIYDSPNVTINATGTVTINGHIDLHGASPNASDPYGHDGGDLSINASSIYVNDYLHTWGGSGYYDYVSTVRIGTDGGDGGNINLIATTLLDISPDGAWMKLYGGSGGAGGNGGPSGAAGTAGVLNYEGATISVDEITADINSELNMYDYNAQMLDFETMSLYGKTKKNEELSHRDNSGTWMITYNGGAIIDYVEDIYWLSLKSISTVHVTMTFSSRLADIDIALVSRTGSILASSTNGVGSSESFTTAFLSAGDYMLWVSFSDDCSYTGTVIYMVQIGP